MVSKISWSFIQLLFLMFDAGARDEQYPEQVSTNHVLTNCTMNCTFGDDTR